MADTTDFTAIHTSLRLGGRALARAVSSLDPADERRRRALQRYWRGYAGEVLAHHTVEDDIFYPALVERVPAAAAHLARIDADHELLDTLMEEGHAVITGRFGLSDAASIKRAAYVLRHLDTAMHTHLDYEDAELVVLFERHFDQREYDELSAAAARSLGVGTQALFTVPFVGSWLTPSMREHLLGQAPLAFRVLYALTRRRHERLAETALGDARTRVREALVESA